MDDYKKFNSLLSKSENISTFSIWATLGLSTILLVNKSLQWGFPMIGAKWIMLEMINQRYQKDLINFEIYIINKYKLKEDSDPTKI